MHQESLCVHRLNFLMTFSLKVLAAKCCLLLPSELPAGIKGTCWEVLYLRAGEGRARSPGPVRSSFGPSIGQSLNRAKPAQQSCSRAHLGQSIPCPAATAGAGHKQTSVSMIEMTEMSPRQPAGTQLCQKCPPVPLRAAPPGALNVPS